MDSRQDALRGAHARRANAYLAQNGQPAGRLTGSVVVRVSPLHTWACRSGVSLPRALSRAVGYRLFNL